MKPMRSVAARVAAKVKQLTKQVASVRQISFGDEELIRLALEAWCQWREAADILRRDGIVVECQTEFDSVKRKHPAVEAERQFHNEYVSRLYDLQIVTKDKKAKKKQDAAAAASDDPFQGLRIRIG